MSIHPGRARALLPVLAASGLLLTGCGGQDAEPAPTVTTTVVRTPEASPSTEPTQTTSSPRPGASEGSHHSGSGSPSSADGGSATPAKGHQSLEAWGKASESFSGRPVVVAYHPSGRASGVYEIVAFSAQEKFEATYDADTLSPLHSGTHPLHDHGGHAQAKTFDPSSVVSPDAAGRSATQGTGGTVRSWRLARAGEGPV